MVGHMLDITSHWETTMPLNTNRKLTNEELAHRYFNLSMEAKNLFERWLMTESDSVWAEYATKRKQAEMIKLTLSTRNVEAA